ncbi:MAG TPA: tyrosine-protein phosphatase [Clostridiales bacterium]|nr:tyrosine-protein phosphatase [Clostridiales bacterium]
MEKKKIINYELNLRDLGGYETVDGRRVKWGMIYRSAEPKGLKPENLECFQSLGIRTICDLRSDWEVGALNEEVMENCRYFNFPLTEENDFQLDVLKDLEKVREFSYHTYRNFVRSPHCGKFFKVLLDEENFPLLIHCVGGKDRTGIICALILIALGVPKKTIVEDYMLSVGFVDRLLQRYQTENTHQGMDASFKQENINAFFYPHEDYLNAALDEILKTYGTFENYFDHVGLIDGKRKELCGKFLD